MPVRSPFGSTATAREVTAGRRLSGVRALITGATNGIGLETARALAAAGAEVLLAVRNVAKGEQVARQLRESADAPPAQVVELDVSSLQSVRAAAGMVLQRWPKVDLLITNAGVMLVPLGQTADGFELHWGTNHLGHALLTQQLLPALRAAAPARVVVVSSSGHRHSPVHFDDVSYRHRAYEKWQAYGQSKTANALFAVALQQRVGDQGITANAVNPGGTRTSFPSILPAEELRQRGWMDEQGNDTAMLKTPEQGAATQVWAAVAPELEGVGGLYLEDCRQATALDDDEPWRGQGCRHYARDPEIAERLWALTQQQLGLPRA